MSTREDLSRPKYNRCDSCGRNAHKVAIRYERDYARGIPAHVTGYCPSCVALDADHLRGQLTDGTATLVYDLRGKKDPVLVEETPYQLVGGRNTWRACGHFAERDIDGRCYTCHGDVD